jgi:hypothetical protein
MVIEMSSLRGKSRQSFLVTANLRTAASEKRASIAGSNEFGQYVICVHKSGWSTQFSQVDFPRECVETLPSIKEMTCSNLHVGQAG